MTTPEPPDDQYPSSWRPRWAPVPESELAPLEVETYIASLSTSEHALMMARVKRLKEETR